MSSTDCRGLPVTCADQSAIDGLERAHDLLLIYTGDPIAVIDEVLEAHPDFIMGHCFKAAVLTQSLETRIYDEMVASVMAAAALHSRANDRERRHIGAVQAWANGDFYGAQQAWEDILTYYPYDLLAMQLGHLTAVLLGDVPAQRDAIARVFPLWNESMPGYEFVLGYYSFGLEENRDFMYAEELARQSLAIRPVNPYAVHTVAHVMEMKGRQRGGINFMQRTRKSWEVSNFANHLWWHTTLFHLDMGDTDSVLDIYDEHLRSNEQSGDRYEELDAAAVLWRMHLLGVDTGNRWSELADKWEPSATDTLYAFNDVHAMMTFAADDRTEAAARLLNANARYVEHANDANVAMSRDMGLPFCHALQAFAAEDFDRCVDLLMPVRYRTHRLGGSFAQRDVIGWTLLEAAMRAGRHELALGLANERCERKPSSAQNWRYIERANRGLGRQSQAAKAQARVDYLTIA